MSRFINIQINKLEMSYKIGLLFAFVVIFNFEEAAGLSDACPAKCYSCRGATTCLQWCSQHDYCGSSDEHKEGGTDCTDCVLGDCARAVVGKSSRSSKKITIPFNRRCPKTVSKSNWLQGDTYGDTFSVDQFKTHVIVTRTDKNEGWGMELMFECCDEPKVCIPYSKEACEAAANSLGLEKGYGNYNFAGSYGTKGCYAYETGNYAGVAFYGTGGSEDNMKVELNDPQYRPVGHDCVCVPYSEEACAAAVDNLDLQKGYGTYDFADIWGTKGCYAYETGSYAGVAFYGGGGSEEEKKENLSSPKYRPEGHDCIPDCKCNDEGTQISEEHGNWCYLRTTPCKLLTGDITNVWAWARCEIKDGPKQLDCPAEPDQA